MFDHSFFLLFLQIIIALQPIPYYFAENGVIDFCEFLNLMALIQLEGDSERELMDVFRVLDQDDDGFVCHCNTHTHTHTDIKTQLTS